MRAASIMFAMGAMLSRPVAQLKMPRQDAYVVPVKLPNKAVGETPAAAEVVEGRPRAKGNVVWPRTCRTLRRIAGARQFGMRRALLWWRLIVGT